MNYIHFNNHFSIKKIEPNHKKDWIMIHELEQDSLVTTYLWNLTTVIQDSKYRYLAHDDIYNSPFSIYHGNQPIGFLQISPIYKSPIQSSVDLSYALLKKERKKGYMTSVLTSVSDYILEDDAVDAVTLMIQIENIASQMVAEDSGFTETFFSNYDEDYFVYQKKKEK